MSSASAVQNNYDGQGIEILFDAVQAKNLHSIEELIRGGLCPNEVDRQGLTPLHRAVYLDSTAVIETLLELSADPNKVDKQLNTPLHYAARVGLVEPLKSLFKKGPNLNAQNGYEQTPLYLAILENHEGAALALLDNGADPNFTIGVVSVLEMAIEKKANKVVAKLLEKKADQNGGSFLHSALEKGNLEVFQMLLDARADPDIPPKYGRSLLSLAATKDDWQAIRTLNGRGGVDGRDQRPIHSAAKRGFFRSVEALIETEADKVDALDSTKWTPLHWAVSKGEVETARVLLKY